MATTVVVSPVYHQQDPTASVVQLEIHPRPEDYIGIYDRLEVWRSELTQSGPYEELTALTATPATVPSTASPILLAVVSSQAFPLDGKRLSLLLGGSINIICTFSGDLNLLQTLTQILAAGHGLITGYVDLNSQLVLQTATYGSTQRLSVVGGDAASILGFPVETTRGKETRLVLSDVHLIGEPYTFIDAFSSRGFFYKTRFRNSSTQAVSEYSQPFVVQGNANTNISIGELTLIQHNGRALINQEVRVWAAALNNYINGQFIAGCDITQMTDVDGHVEFPLVKGQQISISVPGTNLFRLIKVPEVSRFNLLAPEVGVQDDNFKVSVPELVAATRRNL